MSIVTKTGDQGETSLMYGRRVPKSDPRVEAGGAIDELTASLGLARASCTDQLVAERIFAIQRQLIDLMGEVATLSEDRERYLKDGFRLTSAEMVQTLEEAIVDLEKDKSLHPKDWVIPGGNPAAAALDLARTAARRAERRVVSLPHLNPEIIRYLNRLSDLCWLLARYLEKMPPR